MTSPAGFDDLFKSVRNMSITFAPDGIIKSHAKHSARIARTGKNRLEKRVLISDP